MSEVTGQSRIKNTTAAMREDPAEPLLALAIGDGFIEEQERAGQAQLVNSDRLPTRVTTDGRDDAFIAVGFTFGPPDARDSLFRPATLPSGWKRKGSDHAMWSYIVDQHGRRRVAIFYKAAFYDRDAFMGLESHHAYLRSVLRGAGRPVLDDEWLTAATAREVLEAIARSEDERAVEADGMVRPNDDYWPGRAAEHRADAATARALAASL